jgi:hypothetical protein
MVVEMRLFTVDVATGDAVATVKFSANVVMVLVNRSGTR